MTASPTTPESCAACGFVWDLVDPDSVPRRVTAATARFAVVVATDPAPAARLEPTRWSTLEYGAHLRDVLLSVRDRAILAVLEDVPSPPPLYRDRRVELGLYAHETPESVARSLAVASDLFVATFAHLSPRYGERRLVYSQLVGGERTVNWVGAQAVHECEHHLADVEENARSRT